MSLNPGRETILVVVAHTDDEALGCGATLARHAQSGDAVYGISMTDGVGSRIGAAAENAKQRARAAGAAAGILGMSWLEAGTFPDNALDTIALLEVVRVVESAKRQVKPTIVYTHSPNDLNIDHRIVCQAVLTAFRPQPNESWKEIRAFEVPSSTDYGHVDAASSFNPNLIVAIESTWEAKLRALKEYADEMREAPHARSFEGLELLARFRGTQNGLKMAEAFQVLRRIER